MIASKVATAHIEVIGTVQGVGFRPFVHRLATKLGLVGRVGNDSARVFIDVEGDECLVDEFIRRLQSDAPPLSQIESIEVDPLLGLSEPFVGFEIVQSRAVDGPRTQIPPDTAPCADCIRELRDPADRRYRHPFISCTNCGPRFTIIVDLPYDRPATTMAEFEMCVPCRSEYLDPGDRRYHAQPIACHDCGPQLQWQRSDCETPERDVRSGAGDGPLATAIEALSSGQIVAIKGLGGYQLACDATSTEAVAELRYRKKRPDKPFAVMAADVEMVRSIAQVSTAEEGLLLSPAAPIVLLKAKQASPLSPLVAPGNPLIGVMLPVTPLHALVFDSPGGVDDTCDPPAVCAPLVMTSGNLAGEPLAHLDDDAHSRLGHIADGFLTHNRPIQVPCDDSVVRIVEDALLPVRRARGYAPIPVAMGHPNRSVLATGAEIKNTFCLTSNTHGWVSPHMGDMENLETLNAFNSSVGRFTSMYQVEPEVIAVDAHPAYLSSKWARNRFGEKLVEVQHHHAHIASLMAEAGLDPHTPIVGMAFDGTGYGDDGTIWGGEVLLADANGYRRLAHLAPIDLPGGDAAVLNPWRVALSHLYAAGVDWDDGLPPVAVANASSSLSSGLPSEVPLGHSELVILKRQLERRFATVSTTSMGRLFDAVASLLGLRHEITYEAQAAIDLEILAADAPAESARPYTFTFNSGQAEAPSQVDLHPDGRLTAEINPLVISPAGLWAQMVADVLDGVPPAGIAAGFHRAVANLVVDLAQRFVEPDETVALSGGVFQNALLVKLCVAGLNRAGFQPVTHRLVPPNDGGLSLGQAWIAAHQSARIHY